MIVGLLLACATEQVVEEPDVDEPAAPIAPVVVPAPAPPAPVPPAPSVGPPPDGLVDLRDDPDLRFAIRYATDDNFTGAPLPGYEAPGAWMTPAAAEALGAVADDLAPAGLQLLVYDAYRPVRATEAMVAWTERVGRQDLVRDGYIAARSGHNRGHTVDLTLVDPDGTPLDMGTPWDTFSAASHTENATGPALANRHRLRDAMVARGFRPYSKEWWHFGFRDPTAVPRDVPYVPASPGVDRHPR